MHVLVGTSDGPAYEGGNVLVTVAVLADDGRPWDVIPTSVTLAASDEEGVAVPGAAGAMTRHDEDAGTATSATTTSLTDSSQAWRLGWWRGALVQIVAGTGSGQIRRVKGNDADTLDLDPMLNGAYVGPWAVTPDATSQYRVHLAHWTRPLVVPAGAAGTSLDVLVTVADPAGGDVVRGAKVLVEEA